MSQTTTSDRTNTSVFGVDPFGRLFSLPPEPDHPLLGVLTRIAEAAEKIAQQGEPVTYTISNDLVSYAALDAALTGQLYARLSPEPEAFFIHKDDYHNYAKTPDILAGDIEQDELGDYGDFYRVKLESVEELGEFVPAEVSLVDEGVFIDPDDYYPLFAGFGQGRGNDALMPRSNDDVYPGYSWPEPSFGGGRSFWRLSAEGLRHLGYEA